MLYRQMKNGQKVSLLGYGCMRFPTRMGRIDVPAADKLMKAALDGGVNYFDTAWPYHAGQSESYLGSFLKREGVRERVNIATKMPTWSVKKQGDYDKYFSRQLEKLQTEYIDFYLMHLLISWEDWVHLKEVGALAFIEREKKRGRIRQIGFSFHGDEPTFKRILDDYDWDFCQIQFNILDEHNQAGRAGLERAAKKGIPVIVMEPLRGGLLGREQPAEVKKALASYHEKRTPGQWFMQWAMSQPGVACVLSGMSYMAHVKENLQTASIAEVGSMNAEELGIIGKVKAYYHSALKVPCTGCRYCMPCPAGVDIPRSFDLYNTKHTYKKPGAQVNYILWLMGVKAPAQNASLCIRCGKCMQHCPQAIQIPDRLQEVAADMEKWPVKRVVAPIMRAYMGRKKDALEKKDS